jgi:hypothetical protein
VASTRPAARRERLAAALRLNLKRRKIGSASANKACTDASTPGEQAVDTPSNPAGDRPPKKPV